MPPRQAPPTALGVLQARIDHATELLNETKTTLLVRREREARAALAMAEEAAARCDILNRHRGAVASAHFYANRQGRAPKAFEDMSELLLEIEARRGADFDVDVAAERPAAPFSGCDQQRRGPSLLRVLRRLNADAAALAAERGAGNPEAVTAAQAAADLLREGRAMLHGFGIASQGARRAQALLRRYNGELAAKQEQQDRDVADHLRTMMELLPPRWRQRWEHGTPYDMMMENVGRINHQSVYKWAFDNFIFYEEPTARPEDRWIPTGMECSVAEAIAAAGGPLKDHPSWSVPHTITGLHVIIDRTPWDDARRRDRALDLGATTPPQQPAFDVDVDSLLPMRRPQSAHVAPTPSVSCQWGASAAPRRLRLQPPRPALTAARWATPAAAFSLEQGSIFSAPAFNSVLPTVTSAAAGAHVAQRVMMNGRSAAVAAAGMGDHAPCLLAYHAAAAAPPAPRDETKPPGDTAGRKKRWWGRRAAACVASGVLFGGLHLLCSAGSAAASLLTLTT